MALIFESSTCAICGELLDRPYTATSGVFFPYENLLYRYCDAPLHFECLERWPERGTFSAGYFEMALNDYRLYGNLLIEQDNWILGCGRTRYNKPPEWISGSLRNELPHYAEVRLSDWPFRLYSYWSDWDTFIGEGYREGLAGEALKATERIMAEVRQVAPDGRALLGLLEKSYRNAA